MILRQKYGKKFSDFRILAVPIQISAKRFTIFARLIWKRYFFGENMAVSDAPLTLFDRFSGFGAVFPLVLWVFTGENFDFFVITQYPCRWQVFR